MSNYSITFLGAAAFAKKLNDKLGWETVAPTYGQEFYF